MENYLTSLLGSEMPFGPTVVAVVWSILFFANHWFALRAQEANDAQSRISVENPAALRRGRQPRYVATQIIFAALVFLAAIFFGGPFYVFFAGGLLVATTYALTVHLQGWLSAQSLGEPTAGRGSFTFSTSGALRHMSQRSAQGAVGSLVLGLVLGHLALLGGALFLGSNAAGCLRRSRSIGARP